MESKEISALRRAITKIGGQSALARACGVKQGHVWHWLNKSLRVPAEYAFAIEAATEGAVTRHELRPDLFEAVVSSRAPSTQLETAHFGSSGGRLEPMRNATIAEQIAALEARQHRAVREALLNQSGGAERLAKLDRAIAALRALGEGGENESGAS